ncbi:DUF2914 domain-containing protein [Algibacillus agarilyticus]|uniref:DUF2914 domain-containing protein n=1 Tax=Algibacillus agarilyticus TaxID=2234133 RepID=UPI000DCFA4F4|nr:DUF2914 domain-containing protein [Algibacillus agarilyticus]
MAKAALKIQVKIKRETLLEPEMDIDHSPAPFNMRKVFAALAVSILGCTGLVHAIADPEASADKVNQATQTTQTSAPPTSNVVTVSSLTPNLLEIEQKIVDDKKTQKVVGLEYIRAADVKKNQQANALSENEINSVSLSKPLKTANVGLESDVTTSQAELESTTQDPHSTDKTARASSKAKQAQTKTSAFIKRSVLSSAIESREPVVVESTRINAQTTTFKLYMFTELQDYTKQTITHRWFWRDKVVSEVTLDVKDANWRTWSSKRILWRWQGDWRVEVLDADNNLLDVKRFKYGV